MCNLALIAESLDVHDSCSTLSSMSTGKLIAYAFGGMAVVAVVGAAIVFGLKTAQKKKQVANGQHSEAPLRRKAAGRRDSVSDESEDDSDSEASEPSPKQRVGPRKGSAASSGHSRKGSTASAGYPADRKASRSASHSRRPSEGLSKGIEPPPSTHHEPPQGQVVRQHSRKTSREVAPADTDVSEDDYVEPIAPGKRSGGHERKRSEERRPSEVKRATRV